MPDLRGRSQQARERRMREAFEAHYHDILAYALRRLRDTAEAEEVAADTFAVAWRRIERMPERPLPWLYAVARRVLANHSRSERRRGRLSAELANAPVLSPRQPDDIVSARTAIAEALDRVPERQREVLLLIAWEGLDNGEAAKSLGCSRANFAVRLHRARKRLAKELDRSGHTGGEEHEAAGMTRVHPVTGDEGRQP